MVKNYWNFFIYLETDNGTSHVNNVRQIIGMERKALKSSFGINSQFH